MTQVVVGQTAACRRFLKEDLSVSVIIPCKDEKGNIEDAVRRIPQLGQSNRNYFL